MRASITVLCGLAVPACASDQLINPSPDDRLFEVVAVDGEPLPFAEAWAGGGRVGGGGGFTLTLRAAEILLRPDSTAVLVQRIHLRDGEMDSVAVDTVQGFWAMRNGGVVWCPNTFGGWGPCTGTPSGGDLIVDVLSGRMRSHAFRLRERS